MIVKDFKNCALLSTQSLIQGRRKTTKADEISSQASHHP